MQTLCETDAKMDANQHSLVMDANIMTYVIFLTNLKCIIFYNKYIFLIDLKYKFMCSMKLTLTKLN